MRARRALAACGAFVMVTCGGDALSAGTAGVTAADVEAVLRAAGDEARVVRADADTARIEALSPDYAYSVDLYRCAEGRCRAVEFRAVFPEYAGPAVDLSVIDDWNAQTLFGKALLEPDGPPAL